MANRSHLYTCDAMPGGSAFYARGLSESNWSIPLVHKVMMGNEPRVVPSAIWDQDIGILAEREGAFDRALAFFEKIGTQVSENRQEFERELAKMRTFLSETPPTRYLLLEAGEILDLLGGELVESVRELVAEIRDVRAMVDAAMATEESEWVAALAVDWTERARPGWWSHVLYYSFGEPEASSSTT